MKISAVNNNETAQKDFAFENAVDQNYLMNQNSKNRDGIMLNQGNLTRNLIKS